jgi:hypothetical protein
MDKNFLENIDLTDQEKSVLNIIENKIQKYLESTKQNNLNNIEEIMENPSTLGETPFHSKHITTYEREIFVHLEMEISAINENGQLTEVGQILENFYHIPVPSGSNYIEKIQNFTEKFEKELNNCAIQIHKHNESK